MATVAQWVGNEGTRFWGIPRQSVDRQATPVQVFGEFTPEHVLASHGDNDWGVANQCGYVARDIAYNADLGKFALATYPAGCMGVPVWEEASKRDVWAWLLRNGVSGERDQELMTLLGPVNAG
jgi:hypothetical protein